MPIELVMGVSVYSLGFVSRIGAFLKGIQGGDVDTLTRLLYEAREKAFNRLQEDARRCQADIVIGARTRIYHMGNGLIEVMAIGTAVKKIPNLTTKSLTLIPQAITQDRNTFIDIASPHSPASRITNENTTSANQTTGNETTASPYDIIGLIMMLIFVTAVVFYIAKYHPEVISRLASQRR
jgi:uncharacterized protein YbjQ (UPF0145 family)